MFLCSALMAVAQNKMSVESFKMNETDLTANQQGTIVFDQNGEKCALIRIETTHSDFTFDVGSLGISKVEYKTGEVWVYVPHGVRKIKIRHKHLGSLEYAFPVNIQKARTYEMKLTAGEIQTIVKQAVTSQYVLFRVTPANAVVELEGEIVEVYDGTATKRLPFGSYSYRVHAPRHTPQSGTVQVKDPKNKHVVNIELEPQFVNVKFYAPNNGEIWIDNKKYGKDSCLVELGYGTYMAECRLPGHSPSQLEVVIDENAVNVPIVLKEPIPVYGSLDINSHPADADVWIDGKQVGTTPLFLSNCLIGEYNIKITKWGYSDYTQTVTISEGKTENAMINLEKGFSNGVRIFKVKDVAFEMIPVEGGTFQMGATSEQGNAASSDEVPVHSVTLSEYYIGKTEVTQAMWKAVMGKNPSHFKGDSLPVESVSWEDCQVFIEKLNKATGVNFRLPTEAEWEYAARGGKNSKGYIYSGNDTLPSVAWFYSNSKSKMHPVASKQPNELGIYDMSGNVWELCNDWYGNYANDAQTNPMGPTFGDYRVLRGGGGGDDTKSCRVSFRGNSKPEIRSNSFGLRLCLPVLQH